jgi:hypothetical protein
MASLDVPVLCGSLVRLEQLSASHVPDLTLAAEEDRATYERSRRAITAVGARFEGPGSINIAR